MHQATCPKALLKLFHKAGQIICYNILQIDNSLTEATLSTLGPHHGCIMPSNIAREIHLLHMWQHRYTWSQLGWKGHTPCNPTSEMILAFNPRLKYIDIPDATDTAYPVDELDVKKYNLQNQMSSVQKKAKGEICCFMFVIGQKRTRLVGLSAIKCAMR